MECLGGKAPGLHNEYNGLVLRIAWIEETAMCTGNNRHIRTEGRIALRGLLETDEIRHEEKRQPTV